MSLPGDDLVPDPAEQNTRAIEIDAEPSSVWPWIIQIGADRGGFYSYEWLENLFGLGIHNSDVVVNQWQHRTVGDLVFADAKGSGGWYVMEVRPGEALVLQIGDVRAGRPIHPRRAVPLGVDVELRRAPCPGRTLSTTGSGADGLRLPTHRAGHVADRDHEFRHDPEDAARDQGSCRDGHLFGA